MMKKTYYSLLLILLVFATSFYPTAVASHEVQAKVTHSPILLDGIYIDIVGFNIKGNNYFKLRDLAEKFNGTESQFDVVWNGAQNSVEILTGKAYSSPISTSYNSYPPDAQRSASVSKSSILVNGEKQNIQAFNIEGNTYFQLRDISAIIPFEISWDSRNSVIALYSKLPKNAYKAALGYDSIMSNGMSSYYPRWASTVTTYLQENANDTLNVIEAKDMLTIETYNKQFKLLSKKALKKELPLFGGFYSGKQYNYAVFGQQNQEENNQKEVIRIVRYDKNFKKIDHVSIQGGRSYTIEPFLGGSGRLAERDGELVFHTARLRYKTPDGLNHQSQLTIIVNTTNMSVKNNLGGFQANHVSHSFDQYVLYDGAEHILVDHGDAHPRSIVLHKGDGAIYDSIDLFNIPGKIGANMTGVSVGGLEMSKDNYLVAMNTVDHSLVKEYTSSAMVGLKLDQRDPVLLVVPKQFTESTVVKKVVLSQYIGTQKFASIPQLVKVTDEKLVVLWQEIDMQHNVRDLKYVWINQDGEKLSEIRTLKSFVLSSSKPIVMDDKIVWYTNLNGMRIFYSIPIE